MTPLPPTQRLLNWLVALDIFLFACLCAGNVKRNETASSAAWALEQSGRWQGRLFRPLIDRLFFFSPEHCARAWANENKGVV